MEDADGKATDKSELLYVNAKFGDNETRFYRFQNPDDNRLDYFDENGKSIRQFLLRNPVPNGRMTSGFGMRRHPVLKFSRMHTGTDWAAPRGTPILASVQAWYYVSCELRLLIRDWTDCGGGPWLLLDELNQQAWAGALRLTY